MKFLFICPPGEISFKNAEQYPLGGLYLASILEKEGHEVLVKDYFHIEWEISKNRITTLIKNYSPDILGLNCITMNRVSGFKIAKLAKKINPKIKIIMGGVHATTFYEQILNNFPVDVIVLGEGEITTPKLFSLLEKNKSLKKLSGIAFKDKSKVIYNGPREFITDLDSLPFPKHEFFAKRMKKTKQALMITSRGCPYPCIFCSTSVYWGRKWRPRSPKNVVDEIEYIHKNFPYVEKISFTDDTFFLDNQRVIDICDEIIKRKIKMQFSGFGRIDRVSKEMLIKMKQAGFDNIGYGVETGSAKMLKVIDKKITKEHIINALKLTEEVGLKYHVFVMVGNPGETWETVKESAEFLGKFKGVDVGSVSRLEVYPNTRLYALAKQQGFIDDDYWLTGKKVPRYTVEHSEAELTKMAYYIVMKTKLKKGLIPFGIFALKFFKQKPKRVLRYILIRLKIIR